MQRNVHGSVVDGLVLGGLVPTFVSPELDPELGVAHCLTPEALDRALTETPGAVGALAVSPTYFGACADLRGLAEAAHSHGVPLIVDEAWGAHLHFHPDLPEDALAAGADLVISSTHKIVGSLGQAAMLHLGGGELLDEDVVDRCVSLVESTSPSSLLSGSLDAARRQAAGHGRELLAETIATLERTREQVRAIPGLDVLDERLAGRPGVAGWDPLRLSIDVRGTGDHGLPSRRGGARARRHQLRARLRERRRRRLRDGRTGGAAGRAPAGGAAPCGRADRRLAARRASRSSPRRRPGGRWR